MAFDIALNHYKVYIVSTMHNPHRRRSRLHARLFRTHGCRTLISVLALVAVTLAVVPARPNAPVDPHGLGPILAYISTGWDTLTRSMNECTTVVDPKFAANSVMYLPADFRRNGGFDAHRSLIAADMRIGRGPFADRVHSGSRT